MTQEEFQKLVLERFGLLSELTKHVRRIDRNYRLLMRHPEVVIEDEDQELDELAELDIDDEEEED